MGKNIPSTCVVADDSPLVRMAVTHVLRVAFPEVRVLESGAARETLELLRQHACDLLVMDVALADGNSLHTVLPHITELVHPVPVLVLTASISAADALTALRLAAGVVLKSAEPSELLAAIQAALNHGRYMSPELTASVAAALAVGESTPATNHLSEREREVLKLMSRGKSLKEVSAVLSLSDRTVSTYRARLLKKLQLKSTADLLRYAIRHGLDGPE